MQLNSARDVASWVLSAPPFSQNRTITTHLTGMLPATLAETVMAFDREGYIKAFWRREENGNGIAQWRWCLHRTKRRLGRDTAQVLVQQAALDAGYRGVVKYDD